MTTLNELDAKIDELRTRLNSQASTPGTPDPAALKQAQTQINRLSVRRANVSSPASVHHLAKANAGNGGAKKAKAKQNAAKAKVKHQGKLAGHKAKAKLAGHKAKHAAVGAKVKHAGKAKQNAVGQGKVKHAGKAKQNAVPAA